MRLLDALFNGKKPISVKRVVEPSRIEPQRRKLTHQLQQIDKGYKKIDSENKKMKREIDIALAIAISTGGLR